MKYLQLSRLRIPAIIALFIGFLAIPSSGKANPYQQQQDSLKQVVLLQEGEEKLATYSQLITTFFLIEITDEDVNDFLSIADAFNKDAEKQKDYNSQGRLMVNTIVFLRNNQQYKAMEERTPGFLHFLSKHNLWNYYHGIQSNILSSYLDRGNLSEAIKQAQALYQESKAAERNLGIAISLLTIGEAYQEQRRFDEALKQFEEAIAIVSQEEKVTPISMEIYGVYCNLLIGNKDCEKALEKLKEYEDLLDRYEKQVGYEMHNARANILRFYANCYIVLEEGDKAEPFLDKADSLSMDRIGQINSAQFRACIYRDRGEYTKALEQISIAEELEKSNLSLAKVSVLMTKASILAKLNDAQGTYSSYDEAYTLADSINYYRFSQQLDELRTVYEVDKLMAEKERQRIIVFWVLTGSILLLIALLIYILYSRRLKKKNIDLVKQIREQDRLDKELKEEHAELKKLRQVLQEKEEEPQDEQDELFDRLERLMEEKQAYTDSSLNRRSLSEMLNTNEKYLRLSIEKQMNMTVGEYINRLRLKHAKDLLLQPAEEYTIEAVALDSGFGSRSSFYALFRSHYGLAPDEFRKIARKSTS
ncbi:AraC family transcriptional regulator [Bacteroidales bacterium OttesenSCG-928-L03]|nr:AraC family transcriptional regulator [Bacteroidales bacterium OttesenSCG-928-L03]